VSELIDSELKFIKLNIKKYLCECDNKYGDPCRCKAEFTRQGKDYCRRHAEILALKILTLK
jgi:hypothetical protein